MDKIYIHCSLFFSIFAFGQVEHQASQLQPQIGDTYSTIRVEYVEQDTVGQNLIWDYSNLSIIGTSNSTRVYEQGDTTLAQDNLRLQFSSSFQDLYVTDSTVEQFYSLTTYEERTYTNPETVLFYPMSYGDTIIDDFVYAAQQGNINISANGSSTFTVDGEGTLILPHATYYNVLRVKIEMNLSQYVMGDHYFTERVSYRYYAPFIHDFVLTFVESNTGNSSLQAGVMMVDDFATADNEIIKEIEVYPNPFQDKISVNLEKSESVVINVFNAQGRLIYTKDVKSKGVQLEIETSAFEKGIYILQLLDNKGEILKTQQLIKI